MASPSTIGAIRTRRRPRSGPDYRPVERFWPYVDLPEQPTDGELAALSPELSEALFGTPRAAVLDHARVFARSTGPTFARAMEMARASREFRELRARDGVRYRARFLLRRRGRGCAICSRSSGAPTRTEVLDRRSSRAVRARAVAAAGVVSHPIGVADQADASPCTCPNRPTSSAICRRSRPS